MEELFSVISDEPLADVPSRGQAPTHIKRHIIYATGASTSGGAALEELEFRIASIDSTPTTESGQLLGSKSPEEWIAEMPVRIPKIFEEDLGRSFGPRTALDVIITQPCILVFWLYGDYWEFMGRDELKGADRMKAKIKPGGPSHANRYGKLKGRRLALSQGQWTLSEVDCDKRANVISIECDAPEEFGKNVSHAFNFYVQMNAKGNHTVPIIIDPNVENQGGKP